MSGDKFTGLPEMPPSRLPAMDLDQRVGGPGGGAGRWLLVGCGGLFFLLGIAAIVFLFKADDFLGWTFGKLEETVVARLPEDLPPESRRRLEVAFDGAIERIVSGEADPRTMQALQARLSALTRSQDRLTVDEVRELTLTLEAVATGALDTSAGEAEEEDEGGPVGEGSGGEPPVPPASEAAAAAPSRP